MGETPDGIGDEEMNGDGCIDREHTTQRIKIAAGGGWPWGVMIPPPPDGAERRAGREDQGRREPKGNAMSGRGAKGKWSVVSREIVDPFCRRPPLHVLCRGAVCRA
jgi:hypothetical protein